MDLRVGNRARVAAVAVGTCELVLPSGLNLLLSCTFFKFKQCFSFLLDKEVLHVLNCNERNSIYKDDVYLIIIAS